MNEWVTEKPDFKEECLVIAASRIGDEWEYVTYQIKIVTWGEGEYFGWLNGEGVEFGDLEDFVADKYFVMPLLK